jgi:hypothetical protein
MHFTVVFESHESHDLSFGLVFVPTPTWVRGAHHVCTPNTANPHYEIGSVRKLLDTAAIDEAFNTATNRRACIVTHSTGHGTADELEHLVTDLKMEGFSVVVHDFKTQDQS